MLLDLSGIMVIHLQFVYGHCGIPENEAARRPRIDQHLDARHDSADVGGANARTHIKLDTTHSCSCIPAHTGADVRLHLRREFENLDLHIRKAHKEGGMAAAVARHALDMRPSSQRTITLHIGVLCKT
eukprot:PhM_4_TR15537/c0_g1_i1/m.14727